MPSWHFGLAVVNYPMCPLPNRVPLQIVSGQYPLKLPDSTPPLFMSVAEFCFARTPDERPDFEALLKLLAPGEKPPISGDYFDTYAT